MPESKILKSLLGSFALPLAPLLPRPFYSPLLSSLNIDLKIPTGLKMITIKDCDNNNNHNISVNQADGHNGTRL